VTREKNKSPKLALTTLRGSAVSAMPFIEDELLWCPSNDGRMVSDFQSIQVTFIEFPRRNFLQKLMNPLCLRNFQDMSDAAQQIQPQSQPQALQPTSSQSQDLENCDLANLESLNVNDSDELLRQLTENTFELETFFSEFSTADIKVSLDLFLLKKSR
jgi:hypothetical protein